MKYLMIYEAFQAKAISNIIKHVRKEVNSRNINHFINDLKGLQNTYDFPIDKIQKEDIKYLPSKKALKIFPDESTKYYNDKSIFNVKFWFSIENGYLGKTGTGNYTFENKKPFNDTEIDYIKNNLNIKKGNLYVVNNYCLLNHGDYVIGYFNESENTNYLSMARIFRDDDRLYAIQNVSEGSTPDGSSGWQIWGNSSWSLGHCEDPNDDHKKLHLYKKGDNDLSSDGKDNKDHFILSNGKLDTYTPPHYIDDSDFAIVLDINGIFKRGFKKVSGIRKEREESRLGATSLMSDDEIKNINITKYLKQILGNMGIKDESNINDLNNLQKFVKIILCDEFSFYTIFRDSPNISNILTVSKHIYRLLEEEDIYYYDSLIEKYQKFRERSEELKRSYKKSIDIVESEAPDEVKKLFSYFNQISKMVMNYLNSNDINNLYDLNAIYYKLKLIQDLLNDDRFYLSSRNIISNFYDSSDVSYYLERLSINDINDDIKKLDYLIKNIKSVLN
jgi:hypothetical protein